MKSRNILREISRCERELAQVMPWEEVVEDDSFTRYLQNMADSVIGNYADPKKVIAIKNKRDNTIAYTNDINITINLYNYLTTFYKKTSTQVLCLLGILFHECAHILYLDFAAEREAVNSIKKGEIYGNLQRKRNSKKLREAVKNEALRPIFTSIYHNISNIISDVHDEKCICDKYGGLVERSIFLSAESMRLQSNTLEEMIAENASEIQIMFSLILQYLRYGKPRVDNPNAAETRPYLSALEKVAPYCIEAKETEDIAAKYSAINNIVLVLFPYIEKELENQQNQQTESSDGSESSNGSNGSGSSDSSGSSGNTEEKGQGKGEAENIEKAVQQILNQLAKANENVGQSQEPQISHSRKPVNNGERTPSDKMSIEEAEASAERHINKIKNEIARGKAEQIIEKRLTSELSHEVLSVDLSSSHKNVPVKFNRPLKIPASAEREYQRLLSEVKPYSKTLQKRMLKEIEQYRDDSTIRHLNFGRKIEASDSYRTDARFFSKKKRGDELPDMSICVLVDESGSMHGERTLEAKKAAILLDDFAKGLNIPLMVCGHNSEYFLGKNVNFTVYADFDRVGNNDSKRLALIDTAYRNRDGLAINIAADILSGRPESVKLLVVITDGKPNCENYHGEAAKRDIQEIVKKYKRSGIETIALAIGDDKQVIKQIYNDKFVDISDLSLLPKELIRVIKKRMFI